MKTNTKLEISNDDYIECPNCGSDNGTEEDWISISEDTIKIKCVDCKVEFTAYTITSTTYFSNMP